MNKIDVYQCKICSKIFYDSSHVLYHIIDRHKNWIFKQFVKVNI
jgi:5-methylcytosine-specific restriction endonuclease McrA